MKKNDRGDPGLIARLQELEKEEGSFAALSRRTDVHEAALRSYVRKGIRIPSDNILKIADSMDVSIEWLVAGRGPKKLPRDEEGRPVRPFNARLMREAVEVMEILSRKEKKGEYAPEQKAIAALRLYRICDDKEHSGERVSREKMIEIARAVA